MRHALLLVVAEGVKHGVGDLLWEQGVHHLILAVIAHLDLYRFVAFDTVDDVAGEVQFVIIADLSAVEVIKPSDDLGQALVLGVVGLG